MYNLKTWLLEWLCFYNLHCQALWTKNAKHLQFWMYRQEIWNKETDAFILWFISNQDWSDKCNLFYLFLFLSLLFLHTLCCHIFYHLKTTVGLCIYYDLKIIVHCILLFFFLITTQIMNWYTKRWLRSPVRCCTWSVS